MPGTSIYDAAGGAEAFQRLAAPNHDLCLADPVLSHAFGQDGRPQHVERLAAYWAEVFGGPPTYSQSYGGHSAMLELHARTGADEEFARRFTNCFLEAVDIAGFPDDEHLRQTMRAYIEDAVAAVEAVAPADAVVPPDLAMPQWGSR